LVRNDQLEEFVDTWRAGAGGLGTRDRGSDQGKSRKATVLVDLASDRGDERLCCTPDPARALFGTDYPIAHDPSCVRRRYALGPTETLPHARLIEFQGCLDCEKR
jgi:hypothetical protein